MASSNVRLFLDQPIAEGQSVPLGREQAHYLFGVMRLGVGDRLAIFNRTSGEWRAEVAEAGKRAGVLTALERTAPQRVPPDLWLIFAPIKKERTDFIVEKATEMGAAVIQPVRTDYTQSARVNVARLSAHAVEAVEQCGGTFIPEVRELLSLEAVLDSLGDRRLMFCDEALAGAATALGDAPPGPWAILIGPEGGFSDAERKRLRALPGAVAVSLGPRILRADTAAVAALTVWQQALGDWG